MAEPTTIIGEFTSVQGNLQGDEDLQVFGRVEGSIQLDRTLLIEPSGVVKADVSVRNAVVSGVVIGNVEASESVRLTAEGRMVGDIAAPRVIIVEGALFKGRVDMGEVEPSMSKTSKVEPAATTKRAAPARGATRPTARPARTTEPALPSRIRAAKADDVEPDEEDEVVEPEKKPRSKPVRRRPTRIPKAPPKAEAEAEDTEKTAAKPPPPKPRVAPRKRRVSVKKKR